MPRTRRKISGSGLYHVVSKGDGGRVIFENDANRLRYIRLLCEGVDENEVLLHAYCIMDNHVHLLIEDCEQRLSVFMKGLGESYACYFAKSSQRVGHVFQGRFWSEPIETDERFLATVRYIHANPETAGICRLEDYPWSSYRAYLGLSFAKLTEAGRPLVETRRVLGMLGGTGQFKQFSRTGLSLAKPFPKSALRNHLSSDELVRVAVALLGRDVVNGLGSMKPMDRNEHLIRLAQAGFLDTEIARISGIGQTSIYRALHRKA